MIVILVNPSLISLWQLAVYLWSRIACLAHRMLTKDGQFYLT